MISPQFRYVLSSSFSLDSRSTVEANIETLKFFAPNFYFISRESAIKITQNLIRFTPKTITYRIWMKICAISIVKFGKFETLKKYLYWKSYLGIVAEKKERKRKIIKIFYYVFPTGLCWLAINTIRKTNQKLLKIRNFHHREEKFPRRNKVKKNLCSNGNNVE